MSFHADMGEVLRPCQPAVLFAVDMQQGRALQLPTLRIGLRGGGAAHRHNPFGHQMVAVAIVPIAVAVPDHHVHAGQERRQRGGGLHVDRDIGVGVVKCRQARHQPIGGGAQRAGDGHGILVLPAQCAQLAHRAADPRHAFRYPLLQDLPGRGERGGPHAAIKQLGIQKFFQIAQGLADRRLGDVEIGGSALNAAAAGDGLEHREQADGGQILRCHNII